MKFPTTILVFALPLLGAPLGYVVKNVASKDGRAEAVVEEREAAGKISPASQATGYDFPRLVTGETLASLSAQGDGVGYGALSLWLLDADATEMAAFYEDFRKGDPGGDLRRLLFINWTRLDPDAAINATKGTDDERLVWWAWAAHDPATAMAAASTPEMQKRVAKGAGEFHPDWVRENYDSIPDEAKSEAIVGVTTWKEDSDHAATLDFLLKHGGRTGSIFTSFARKDPWAAYDWLEKNGRLKVTEYGRGRELETLIEQMKELHPDDLERMAAMTPSGAVKWKMEDAVFESLLSTDPERALANAREGASPKVNAKRLAIIGDTLLSTDPEKAFELGGEILTMTKGSVSMDFIIRYEGGGLHTGGGGDQAKDFLDKLLTKDPYRTLDMAAVAPTEPNSRAFNELSSSVAARDLDGYAAWVNRQTDADILRKGSSVVVNGLAGKGNFEEAAEWALNGYEPEGNFPSAAFSLSYQWAKRDYEGASRWVEAAPLSEKHRENLRSNIKQYGK